MEHTGIVFRYDVAEIDDDILAERADITRFDMNEIEWNDPSEVLDEYMGGSQYI